MVLFLDFVGQKSAGSRSVYARLQNQGNLFTIISIMKVCKVPLNFYRFQIDTGSTTKSFTFNVTFEPEASQEDVFNHSGIKKLIDMALTGLVFSNKICFKGNNTYTLCLPTSFNSGCMFSLRSHRICPKQN